MTSISVENVEVPREVIVERWWSFFPVDRNDFGRVQDRWRRARRFWRDVLLMLAASDCDTATNRRRRRIAGS